MQDNKRVREDDSHEDEALLKRDNFEREEMEEEQAREDNEGEQNNDYKEFKEEVVVHEEAIGYNINVERSKGESGEGKDNKEDKNDEFEEESEEVVAKGKAIAYYANVITIIVKKSIIMIMTIIIIPYLILTSITI